MTDFTKVNNVYYDVLQYNATSEQIEANSDTKLIYPLFNDANNYSVAINKATIDLSTVPLTQKNICLKQYQVGLKIGTTEELSYVRQVNSNQNNFVWNCPQNGTVITKYAYSSVGAITTVSSQDVSAITPYVSQFVVDDYSNVYIIGGSVQNLPDTLYVVDQTSNLILSQKFTYLKNIYMDRGQNLYLCDESATPTVYIYSNNNSVGSVILTETATLTTNRAGDPLVNLLFCVADNEIIVGYDVNTITLYNSQYEPQTDIVESSIFQLQNKANINTTAGTYLLSSTNRLDDSLWGTNNSNEVYVVNTNTQLTDAPINSPLVLIDAGYAFGISTDNYTYGINYPPSPSPAPLFVVNNLSTVKCIWSVPHLNHISTVSTLNAYLSLNFNIGFGTTIVPNTYTDLGTLILNSVPATTVDVNPTTHYLVATGTDNNIYQSTYPVADIEYILLGNNTGINPLMCGLSATDAFGNQSIYQIRTFNDAIQQSNLMTCMFRTLDEYYTFYEQSPTQNNLIIRNALTYAVVSTNNAFDTSVLCATELPQSSRFVYYNADSSTVKLCGQTPLLVLLTINVVNPVIGFCEIDVNHFCVCYQNSIEIYIHTSTTPIFNQNISNIVDIASNTNDLVNGAPTLFMLMSTNSTPHQGNQVLSYTFPDNTYTSLNTPSTVYTVSNFPQNYINSVTCHLSSGRLMLSSTSVASTTTTITTLCQYNGYNVNNKIVGNIPVPTGSLNNYKFNKYQTYLNQLTTSSKIWTEITSNVSAKSVCISKSNPNRLYCISLLNSEIYSGNLISGACDFSVLSIFATRQFNYISNIVNDNDNFNSVLYLFDTLNGQQLITSFNVNDQVGAIARNDVANQYLVSKKNNQSIVAYNPNTLASIFTTTLNGAYSIFAKNGSDIDAGNAIINNISVLINSINLALVDAQTKINQALGAGTIPTPPILSLDYQSGLCTISYPSVLATSGNGILFNQSLINLIYFQSVIDGQSGLNLLTLNTQTESVTQNTKTIYQFNQLSRILFVSNTIFVVGSYYGINSFSHIITDIDVITSDFVENLGQRLYYQPNFLRSYFMNSNLPVDRMQLQVLYEYRDGSQYPLLINSGQNLNVKIQFIRKF